MDAANKDAKTPLHYAAQYGPEKVATLLLAVEHIKFDAAEREALKRLYITLQVMDTPK